MCGTNKTFSKIELKCETFIYLLFIRNHRRNTYNIHFISTAEKVDILNTNRERFKSKSFISQTRNFLIDHNVFQYLHCRLRCMQNISLIFVNKEKESNIISIRCQIENTNMVLHL